jgi:hypothetical protein
MHNDSGEITTHQHGAVLDAADNHIRNVAANGHLDLDLRGQSRQLIRSSGYTSTKSAKRTFH